jgi:hypothetical protein
MTGMERRFRFKPSFRTKLAIFFVFPLVKNSTIPVFPTLEIGFSTLAESPFLGGFGRVIDWNGWHEV